RRASRPRPADPPRPRRRDATRPGPADQAESSQQEMTTVEHTDRETRSLGKRGAFEGVARRHGRRRNPARMTPRSSLRTPTNTPRHSPQAWCEEIGRCIANSETPHAIRSAHPRALDRNPPATERDLAILMTMPDRAPVRV